MKKFNPLDIATHKVFVIEQINTFYDIPKVYLHLKENAYLCLSDDIKNGLTKGLNITDDPYDEELHEQLKDLGLNYYMNDNLEQLIVSYTFINGAGALYNQPILVLYDMRHKQFILVEPGDVNFKQMLLAVYD